MNKTPNIATIILMAIFAFLLLSCEEKKQAEDPAARDARREARREAQKEEIKKELLAEAEAKQVAEAAAKKAEEKKKIEAEIQKLKAEQAKIETELPRAQRKYESARKIADEDIISYKIALNNAKIAGGKMFNGEEKKLTKENANILERKVYNSTMAAEGAEYNINSLRDRLSDLKRLETVAAKKLQAL